MRIVDTEELRSYDGSLLRIRVTCQAVGVVDIESIENPECWSKKNKLLRSDEYLVANVRPIVAANDDKDDAAEATTTIVADDEEDIIRRRIADDYSAVRSMYVDKKGVALRELPPFAVDAVKNNLPELSADSFRRRRRRRNDDSDGDDESSLESTSSPFWESAEVWQMLCNTVREARRCTLQSDVNEITISAAMAKGGPLKLPVHRSDLPGEVQSELNLMEENAATDFVSLGMNPCLDFQALISARTHSVRLRHLARMIRRERKRLEAKESLKELFDATSTADAYAMHNGTSAFK